jgi:predicted esterase
MIEPADSKAAEANRGLHGLRGRGSREQSLFRVIRVYRGFTPLSLFLLSVFSFLLFLSVFWAKARDPFQRVEFTLRTASGAKAKGVAVLPKPVGRLPVVIYLHGSGGSVLGTGNELRQVAELGLAAVGLDYNQTNQGSFDEQFIALHQYLQSQPWAQSNATAWVGFSLGAQRTLSFALRHPDMQPQLIVRRAGGWIPELGPEDGSQRSEVGGQQTEDGSQRAEGGGQKAEGGGEHPTSNIQHPTSNQPGPPTLNLQLSTLHCPVLLMHGERDEVFPVADCKRVAERLRANGTTVELRIFPEMGHVAGEESGPVVRALAEYCAAHLPPADYCSSQRAEGRGQKTGDRGQRTEGGSVRSQMALSPEEAARFNLAMRRAGQHRCELWRAVRAFRGPERHTVMNVIGGLEDYDLAHISAAQLRQEVKSAWRARRTYRWCRDAPLEVFERFVASRRIYEEPLPAWQPTFLRHSLPKVKYARDTGEASDAVGAWLYSRMRFRTAAPAQESSMEELLTQRGWCREGAMMYTYLGRLTGLPMRPVYIIWPTLGSGHWYTEVWSTEGNQWHAVDSANEDRTYHTSWILNVRKSTILATTGERGGWNALEEQRWEAFTNTIGLFYPSGRVAVRVLDRDRPVEGQRVVAQAWLSNDVFSVLAARTDAQGEARMTLGRTARYPYRLLTDGPGETDWQWLTVQSNRTYSVTLDLGKTRPFDKSVEPPPPDFPNWGRSPAQ